MMTNPTGRSPRASSPSCPTSPTTQIARRSTTAWSNGWALSVEYTDDPHPRNTYWEMFGMPMFDLKDAAGVMLEVNACRKTFPNHYIKVNAFDCDARRRVGARCASSCNRPTDEPGFSLERAGSRGPRRCATRSRAYATDAARGRALRTDRQSARRWRTADTERRAGDAPLRSVDLRALRARARTCSDGARRARRASWSASRR